LNRERRRGIADDQGYLPVKKRPVARPFKGYRLNWLPKKPPELEPLDAQAAADVAKRVQAAQAEAGGRNLRTAGGKVVGLEGAPPPKRVGMVEWDSLEKAEAFYKSKAWTDLTPERDKALKTIRRYGVEVVN
jgi:uncharacterized protein (DUF1330 family)